METRSIGYLSLYFEPGDAEAADRIGAACAEAGQFLEETWHLPMPKAVRVYVVTRWLDLALRCGPRSSAAVLACFSPLWWNRFKRLWTFCGGLTQGTPDRPTVAIKPPRLLEQTDRSIGSRIFVRQPDVGERIRHTACHEMVHALAMRLRLPMWLNEGIAMVATDRFLREATVRQDTLRLLKRRPRRARPASYLFLTGLDADALVYNYVRGYWITRFLEATRPGFLRGLLSKRRRGGALRRAVAAELGMRVGEVWREINGIVAAFFEQQADAGRS